MTDNVLGNREVSTFIRSWNIIPSVGGRYEVTLNGELIFSKKELGRHAEPGEVEDLIAKKLDELNPAGYPLPPKEDD